MNDDRAREAILHIEEAVNDYAVLTGDRIDILERRIEDSADVFQAFFSMTIISSEVHLVRLASSLAFSADYHITRAYFHASPSLITIIAAIMTAIKAIWKVVQIIISIYNTMVTLHLNELLYKIFPEFEKAVNKIMTKISEFSKTLGWGVDGVLHLLQAGQGGINVAGALMGKDEGWCKWQWMDRTQKTMGSFSSRLKEWQNDPGKMMQELFGDLNMSTFFPLRGEFGTKMLWLTNTVTRTEEAVKGISTITNELSAIRNDMPAVVAKYIPRKIWDAIDMADRFIDEQLLPRLAKFDRAVAEINAVLEAHSKKVTDLARRLAAPGDLLLGIDDLPERARMNQESKIDDVASRQLARDAEAAYDAISKDLEEFERIDKALKAPTPEPEFMSFESPARKALTGIVEEDRETWFVGDY